MSVRQPMKVESKYGLSAVPGLHLVPEVLALLHHDWSRLRIFDINMF